MCNLARINSKSQGYENLDHYCCYGSFTGRSFAQSKVYFDEDWQPTTQDKMVYYRETTKENGLFQIRDFYKGGKLQMDAFSHNDNPNDEIYEGKVTWYKEDGSISSYAS